MRIEKLTVLLFNVALGAAIRRTFSLMSVSVLAAGLVLTGCGPTMTRPEVDRQKLLKLRSTADEQATQSGERIIVRLLQRTKAEYDRRAAAGQPSPVIDILIVSGGGDWGAFGAGFLKGWLKVPKDHPLAKPEFDAVTGVSTGALIASRAAVAARGYRREHLDRGVHAGVPRAHRQRQRGDRRGCRHPERRRGICATNGTRGRAGQAPVGHRAQPASGLVPRHES